MGTYRSDASAEAVIRLMECSSRRTTEPLAAALGQVYGQLVSLERELGRAACDPGITERLRNVTVDVLHLFDQAHQQGR